MKQFKSQLLSPRDAYLATQQAQTTPDAAANRPNIATSRTAQMGVHVPIPGGTLADRIKAGPAIWKAEAGKSTRDLCKHKS